MATSTVASLGPCEHSFHHPKRKRFNDAYQINAIVRRGAATPFPPRPPAGSLGLRWRGGGHCPLGLALAGPALLRLHCGRDRLGGLLRRRSHCGSSGRGRNGAADLAGMLQLQLRCVPGRQHLPPGTCDSRIMDCTLCIYCTTRILSTFEC